MLRVASRGVYARTSAGWVVPDALWITEADLSQTPGLFAWAFVSGEWLLLAASEPAAPASVTVTAVGLTVQIDWTAAAVEAAESYIVRRPDGSVVGTAVAVADPGSLLEVEYSVVDSDPRPVTAGRYTVEAVLEDVSGDATESGTISIGTAPAPVTSVVGFGTASQVAVGWAASPLAVSYIVTRPSGGGVAYAGTGLSFTDTSPRYANAEPYTVQAVTGIGNVGAAASGPNLSLARPPTGLTATLSGAEVDLAWTNAAGTRDAIQVFRNGVLRATLATSATSWTDTDPPLGTVPVYGVRATIAGSPGPTTTDSVSVPAGVPREVVAAKTSDVGELRLTWRAPADSTITGYRVDVSTDGGAFEQATDSLGPNATSYTYDFGNVPGTEGQFRIRALSDGGSSATVVTAPMEPLIDVTPPADATLVWVKPVALFGRISARFTMPGGGLDPSGQRQVQYRIDGGDIVTVVPWTDAVEGRTYTDEIARLSAGEEVEVRCNVRDRFRNTQTGAWHSYAVVASPTEVTADAASSWVDVFGGVYDPDEDGRAGQGYISDPALNRTGYLYYGGSAIENACSGRTVTEMRVFLEARDTQSANTMARVGLHNDGTAPDPLTLGARTPVAEFGELGTLAEDVGRWLTFTEAQREALAAGTYCGIALYESDGRPWLTLKSIATVPSQGKIRVFHLG